VEHSLSRPRIALVTGANRGIGRSIADGLARSGVIVFVGARSHAEATEAAAGIGHGALPVQLDVTDAASVTAAIQRVMDAAGHIDIVVNNAGGHYDDGVQARTLTDADLLDAFEVNSIGPMRVIRAALPHLLEQRWGRIVNVSSKAHYEAKGIDFTERLKVEKDGDVRKTVTIPKGRLKVVVRSWAHVYVDGTKVGTTPFPGKDLYVGRRGGGRGGCRRGGRGRGGCGGGG
jgi:NAD(P)-dependent dehydrogenase (short-subunit alcohol dehydrogenase family)